MASKRDVAQAELAKRELARRHLIDFSTYTFPQYQVAAHNILLAQYLESVERYVSTGGAEGIGRLMVFMPPRHGKSELVSVRFPTWFLGRNPDKRVILASVTASLATGFSRQGRNIIQGVAYQAVFGSQSGQDEPVGLSEDSRSAEAWNLAGHRGGLVVPHMGRMIIGNDNKALIPVAFFMGAAFLILVDDISRLISTSEMPLGILTSLLGGPFFIYLLRRTRGREW